MLGLWILMTLKKLSILDFIPAAFVPTIDKFTLLILCFLIFFFPYPLFVLPFFWITASYSRGLGIASGLSIASGLGVESGWGVGSTKGSSSARDSLVVEMPYSDLKNYSFFQPYDTMVPSLRATEILLGLHDAVQFKLNLFRRTLEVEDTFFALCLILNLTSFLFHNPIF